MLTTGSVFPSGGAPGGTGGIVMPVEQEAGEKDKGSPGSQSVLP